MKLQLCVALGQFDSSGAVFSVARSNERQWRRLGDGELSQQLCPFRCRSGQRKSPVGWFQNQRIKERTGERENDKEKERPTSLWYEGKGKNWKKAQCEWDSGGDNNANY
jgi:hypothetical protein